MYTMKSLSTISLIISILVKHVMCTSTPAILIPNEITANHTEYNDTKITVTNDTMNKDANKSDIYNKETNNITQNETKRTKPTMWDVVKHVLYAIAFASIFISICIGIHAGILHGPEELDAPEQIEMQPPQPQLNGGSRVQRE